MIGKEVGKERLVGGALGMFEQEIANGLGGRGIRISQHEVEDDAEAALNLQGNELGVSQQSDDDSVENHGGATSRHPAPFWDQQAA